MTITIIVVSMINGFDSSVVVIDTSMISVVISSCIISSIKY